MNNFFTLPNDSIIKESRIESVDSLEKFRKRYTYGRYFRLYEFGNKCINNTSIESGVRDPLGKIKYYMRRMCRYTNICNIPWIFKYGASDDFPEFHKQKIMYVSKEEWVMINPLMIYCPNNPGSEFEDPNNLRFRMAKYFYDLFDTNPAIQNQAKSILMTTYWMFNEFVPMDIEDSE